MSPSRSVLLVGEGNFSFSACVNQFCSESESRVTATCLQCEEDALRHEGAAASIQIIKDSGGTVLFEVDCTKLGECASLQGCVFDLVVFNFPHSGRKSGVKKNRELLKKFFLSCVDVLAEDGEVHVSLCNGQGGTPADQPKREWHNSWQVVSMAAEAHLILSEIHPFESEKFQSYKCTGYRSQDKGFHLENALVHVFSRSLPYSSAHIVQMEEDVEGQQVQYNMPAELSDYMFRGFLSSDSVHPVRLMQDFVLKGLVDSWPVSMLTESLPILVTSKQLQKCYSERNTTNCYWITPTQRECSSDHHGSAGTPKSQLFLLDGRRPTEPLDTCRSVTSNEDSVRSKGADTLRSTYSFDVDREEEEGLYVLRPTLLPHMETFITQEKELMSKMLSHQENKWNVNSGQTENVEQDARGCCKGFSSLLFGVSGVVFRNVPINLWALPAFHELLFRGLFHSECEPVKLLGQQLETLLAPHGVSQVTEQDALCLTAQPMGVIGKVTARNAHDTNNKVSITISLNLDLLAVLLFSLPDWRLLWSHDPRFLKQFELCPSPRQTFCPFSLFPKHFTFDISFWTGPVWEEMTFHAVVREASHGTVQQVKLIDTFSHPDLSQTSYCYRLTYHCHTHALSQTQALQFHKHLESLLSSRLQVTIR
ncbi:ferredoxin-fold anticodon-binding domain-containing protein 1 [Thalassophryne amazonica]|uniref:ferredoxin-fold anticodon-binding domain-containing protein 1 n=1 Tax=Thalassophryne amazonica TaxID=390379 RepID=UPI0014715ADE|nr:ferredoxin-fold anticodon-binding domain-containing protein 1 [Thalassophryne amazonica]